MSKYLLEVGVEELPYKFIPMAISQLKKGFELFFNENKISYDSIKVMATPRRLAVIVEGLPNAQPDVEKIIKGPIASIAFDENNCLTKAGEGFVNKNNLTKADLYVENNYVHAKISIKGKNTKDLLQENVPIIFSKLQGPHFMRWSSNDVKFSRPIRWILSLFDNEQVKIRIIDKDSSNITNGHRFSEQNIIINNPDEYVDKLREAKVIVDQDERKNKILELTKAEADKYNAKTEISDDLLEEVTYICEWPVAVTCDFDLAYLSIPQEVTVTVMETHQRYFALYEKASGKLINKFVTITNYVGNEFENIKAGNLRVIKARLDDAVFFYNEDTKNKKLEDYIQKLDGMTFQKGFGSMLDKTNRIKEIAVKIAGENHPNIETIKRTAELCKADLATSLVYEFTELQGFIGADYALKDEGELVSNGIKEHYFPLNAESNIAQGVEGRVVGIADKIDTICAVFASGKKPTGSSDPLGARRAALGIIKTVMEMKDDINVSDLIQLTLDNLHKKYPTFEKDKVNEEVKDFITQRLVIYLSASYSKTVIEACQFENVLTDLKRYKHAIECLSQKPNIQSMENPKRIAKILKGYEDTFMDEAYFNGDKACAAEKALYKEVVLLKNKPIDFYRDFDALTEAYIKIDPIVTKFFDDVLVMDDDENIRNNRLSLISNLDWLYKNLADFTKL